MTEHYFSHPLVNLHYYKFGLGEKIMLCFHGYGMHGKQFRILETSLGATYTFYGFDLFFHKETQLIDQSLERVKRGLRKEELAELINSFCASHTIDKFSVIGYSMGTHYATALTELLANRIIEYIAIAPSCLKPGKTLLFLSSNRIGNKLLEKLALSKKGMFMLLNACRQLGIVDAKGHDILFQEIATPALRFSFYACATFLRLLITDESQLIKSLNNQNIKSIFIFGKRDSMYPPTAGRKLISQLNNARTLILDENHEMINRNFAYKLSEMLQNDH